MNQSRRYAGTDDIEQIKVPTITLTEVLDERGVEKIDLLSMDIEGGEPAALAGFDIDRFKPELVCIEAQEGVREDIARYFEEHRYRRIEEYVEMDETNWYFTPKGSEQEGGGHDGGGARR